MLQSIGPQLWVEGQQPLRLNVCDDRDFISKLQSSRLDLNSGGTVDLALDWPCLVSIWQLFEKYEYLFNRRDGVVDPDREKSADWR